MMIKDVQAMVHKQFANVRRLAGRAILQLLKDTMDCNLSGLSEEIHKDAELWQHYGFTSRPMPGAECLAVNIGGETAHIIVPATNDRRYRPKWLKDGEAVLYDLRGLYVILREGGRVEITKAEPDPDTEPDELTEDDRIIRWKDLRDAMTIMELANSAKFEICMPGDGVGPVVYDDPTASEVGYCFGQEDPPT